MLWNKKMLNQGLNFLCRKCSGFTDNNEVGEATIDGDVIEKVATFSYLVDVRRSGPKSFYCKIKMWVEKLRNIAKEFCR